MLSFCSQSHVKKTDLSFPVYVLSLDVFDGHCVQSEVLTLRGSCRGYGLHRLSHSQICIFNRIPKLLQCRRLPLIFVNILNACF